MDYNYESLLNQRFQMLCQDLLVREFQGVQCLPVGMSDGGRDAFTGPTGGKNLVVFQVKFSKSPSKRDPAKWLIDAVKGELEKIKNLSARGMTRYLMITNVGGTSHPDAGTIHKVQTFLDANLPVPAQCWWRDDLDRRLDDAYNLKLHYPSLMAGADAIRLMWEIACGGEGSQRRKRALNSYLGYQYEQDKLVRFKQAELASTSLFKLYVDVPVMVQPGHRKSSKNATQVFDNAIQDYLNSTLQSTSEKTSTAVQERAVIAYTSAGDLHRLYLVNGSYRNVSVGAADLLLTTRFSRSISQLVLEGAPGQGKSTLAQYLAQVNRARMLNKPPDISDIIKPHIDSPLKFPIKLELRDVAQWLEGFNPWVSEQRDLHNQPKSLEGAIAGHIHQYSGGVKFDVNDLLELFEAAPVLLILDALDEVAELEQRRKVVKEVEACLARLRQQEIDLQVIVTSRPTAIADSPTFSDGQFAYITLTSLTKQLALHYAERWASARGLDEPDRRDLTRILSAKMTASHMADLAKNTMQLSILLNLIHLRGESLPERRTELYDTYVDVFFNREAEKNNIVKKHRDLLIDIHRYLGFYLHAKAESGGTTGRISLDELKKILMAYLQEEGHSLTILEDLLTGMVERVVAIVSRVEGTYEFEVQPLREYYAARHLYDTASYSPAGRQMTGTKPDRFDGIAPNPYWLNVARFYAGCYSKGELLDLAERVCDLIATPIMADQTYPRRLGIALLQDWVFHQSPKATKRAVEGIFDDFGLRWAAIELSSTGASGSMGDINLCLTEATGSSYLLNIAWQRLLALGHTEAAANLCRYIASIGGSAQEIPEIWKRELVNRQGRKRDEWIEVGLWLGAFMDRPANIILKLLNAEEPIGLEFRSNAIARSGIATDGLPEDVVSSFAQKIVDYPDRFSFYQISPTQPRSRLDLLLKISASSLWRSVAHGYISPEIAPLIQNQFKLPETEESDPLNKVDSILHYVRQAFREPQSLDVWNSVTEALKAQFGKSWTEIEIGVISGDLHQGIGTYTRADNLCSEAWTIPQRVRSARRRAGRQDWWLNQLSYCVDEYDYGLWALSAFAWATPAAFPALIDGFDLAIKAMTARSQENLIKASRNAINYSPHAQKLSIKGALAEHARKYHPATICALFYAFDRENQACLIENRLKDELKTPYVADVVLSFLMHEFTSGRFQDDRGIDLASQCLYAGADLIGSSPGLRQARTKRLKASWAVRIIAELWDVPTDLATLVIRIVGNKERTMRPVWEIAQEQDWFLV